VVAESSAPYRLASHLLAQTFDCLRQCGESRRECQVLWVSPWASPQTLTHLVHPKHRAHRGGFELDSVWLNQFWLDLAKQGQGIRCQIHTHPGAAFHSDIDDAHPIIADAGFLSLVIPRFATGPVGFEAAYLTQLQADGSWQQVLIDQHLEVIP
jgi:hypothetical protein